MNWLWLNLASLLLGDEWVQAARSQDRQPPDGHADSDERSDHNDRDEPAWYYWAANT